MSHNIALLFSNYGPYHIARLESLGQARSRHNLEVTGIELARSIQKYPWQTKLDNLTLPIISVIKNSSLEKTKFAKVTKQLLSTLKQVNPSVLAIAGYFNNPSMLAALIWCRLRNKPAILFSETTADDFPRVWWKEAIKSLIVRQFKSAVVGGTPHKRYLVELGMPEEAIFMGYDVVGNQTFHPQRISQLENPLQKPFFLTANRFVAKKNLVCIIDAYAKYRRQAGELAWDLVLCGDGELRPQLEQQIAELNLQQVVHLPGFLQEAEILPYFAHAGSFIHASTMEQWGLVINEAMAAGLPAIVSKKCGCYEDLIIDGVTGFGFDPQSSEQLTNLMSKVSNSNFDRQTIGRAAIQHIQNFSPNYFATNLIKATQYALKSA